MRSSRLVPAAAGLAFVAMLGVSAVPAAAQSPTTGTAVQAATTKAPRATASSTIDQTIAGVGTFAGTFTPTQFTASNGQLLVTGLVTGTLTSLTGEVTQVSQTVTAPVGSPATAAAAAASCSILTLQLGPLHLNLLGLVVDLNQVNLSITALPGPGNLVGNLLCAVANLLNGGGTIVNGIANRLNQILGL